jgi:hypothetical protein
MQEQPELSARQVNAIVALLSRTTLKAAADAVGVNERTLRRWLEEPRFAAVYRSARSDALRGATFMMQHYSYAAVRAIVKTLKSSDEALRLRAAEGLLNRVREWYSHERDRREKEQQALGLVVDIRNYFSPFGPPDDSPDEDTANPDALPAAGTPEGTQPGEPGKT